MIDSVDIEILQQVGNILQEDSARPAESSPPTPPQKEKPWWNRLPHETHYKDTGCELWPSCLTCPFPRCIKEEPYGASKLRSLARAATVLQLTNQGLTNAQIATILNVTTRTVMRLRKKGAHLCKTTEITTTP